MEAWPMAGNRVTWHASTAHLFNSIQLNSNLFTSPQAHVPETSFHFSRMDKYLS